LGTVKLRKLASSVIATIALVVGGATLTSAEAPAPSAPVVYPDYPRAGQPNLYTRTPDRMSRFYQQLGFQEKYRFAMPDGTVAFTTLQKGPFYLTLTHLDVIRQSTQLRWIGPSLFKQSDLTVLVSDVDATVARLRSSGTRVLQAPTTQPWGERQAFVTDPDGNYVQISTHH
jgi:catechol 2,3-dioxygenase-like lactoylglutathione lyase family enzyme